MSIIGFNFTKISAERKKAEKTGQVQVSNNVDIKEIRESEIKISSDEQISLTFEFEFNSKYEPDMGYIKLGGHVMTIENKESGQKILDEWKDSKKVNSSVMKNILNTILAKANVQALIVSRDINLPSPIPLPKVNVKE